MVHQSLAVGVITTVTHTHAHTHATRYNDCSRNFIFTSINNNNNNA